MIYASLSLLMCRDVNTFLSYNVTNQINTVGPVWHHSSAKMMEIGSAENMNSHGELVWLIENKMQLLNPTLFTILTYPDQAKTISPSQVRSLVSSPNHLLVALVMSADNPAT